MYGTRSSFRMITNALAVSKLEKIFLGPTYKLRSSFTTIPDVYRLFVRNKTTFGEHCLTQWISMLLRNFFPEI